MSDAQRPEFVKQACTSRFAKPRGSMPSAWIERISKWSEVEIGDSWLCNQRTSNQRLKLETSKFDRWEIGETNGAPMNTDFFT